MKICYPNAKVNLGLQVVGKRSDGYHELQTIFLPIPLQDVLELRPYKFYGEPWELQVSGVELGCGAEENLAVRVFADMQREFGLPPQSIHLFKRIPTGAGLGGGSSDAAFMMRLLNESFELGLTADDMARRLRRYGADCPFFVYNKPHYATGIGDVFEPVEVNLSRYTLLLVKPKVSVSTSEAYSRVVPHAAGVDLRQAVIRPVGEWKELIHNDFEDSVFPLYPVIEGIKATLYDMHALYASMSGSGSAVFGIMERAWDDAGDIFPDCFVHQARWAMHKETFA